MSSVSPSATWVTTPESFPNSSGSDIRRRVGPEIPVRTVRQTLAGLVVEMQVTPIGKTRWRRYQLTPAFGQEIYDWFLQYDKRSRK